MFVHKSQGKWLKPIACCLCGKFPKIFYLVIPNDVLELEQAMALKNTQFMS